MLKTSGEKNPTLVYLKKNDEMGNKIQLDLEQWGCVRASTHFKVKNLYNNIKESAARYESALQLQSQPTADHVVLRMLGRVQLFRPYGL